MERVEVAVVGAGPAGAAAAIELARSGRHVVVVDRAVFPRDKCCGDGLTTGALRQLEELGLDPSDVASWQAVEGCWLRSPSGRTVELPFPDDGLFGAVARRADLDAALVALARSAGAEVREGTRFLGMRWDAEGTTVRVEGGDSIGARYVVAADGAWSPVRKAIGLGEPTYLGEWHASRQYVRAPAEGARRMWVWFERELLPGYAWSFPLPGSTANVGFGVRRRGQSGGAAMARAWSQLLALPHVREQLGEGAAPLAPLKAWPIPARLPRSAVTGAAGRVLFAGDAARAADPLTGEGIAQALETGRAAASSILRAGPEAPSTAASRYRSSLRNGMVVDHRLASLLSLVLESTRGARGAVRAAGASEWTRRNFARWLFEDYPRAAIATPARWRKGLLRGPGAFR